MSQNKHKSLIILLFFGVLMGALDISIVGPAIPAIEKTIGLGSRNLGWIFSIYVLFNLVGIPLFSKLSDIYGRRYIYVISLFLFAVGSLVVSFAEDVSTLLVGRAIQGFGSSGIFPVASAVIGDVFPVEKRGRTLGLLGAVWGIAFIIGPILAGTILAFMEWHVLFLINIPIAVVLIFFSFKLIPSQSIARDSQPDWVGIVLLGLLLGAFTYGINRIQASEPLKSLGSITTWPFLTVAVVLFLILIPYERKQNDAVLKIDLFNIKQIRIVAFIAFCTGLLQAAFIFIPSYAVTAYNISTSSASFMLVPFVLATAIGSPLFGRMLDTYGSRIIIIAGLLLTIAGLILLSFSVHSKTIFYFAGAVLGLGMSILAGSSLRYIMLNEAGDKDRAITQGMLTIFISTGQIIGGVVMGIFIAGIQKSQTGFVKAFYFLSAVFTLVFFLSFRLKKLKEERTTKANGNP